MTTSYLKRTGKKGDYKHWFWNDTLGLVTSPQGNKKEKPPKYHYSKHPTVEKRPLQVGDIAFSLPKKEFVRLISKSKGERWEVIGRKTNSIFYDKKKNLQLVCGNIIGCNKKEKDETLLNNKFGAKTKDEVEFAEDMGSGTVVEVLIKNFPNFEIDERTLFFCHHAWFGELYEWAGQYRTEDVVVGKKDNPTMPINENLSAAIQESMKDVSVFFKNFEKITKEHLANLLASLHIDLAWIHPFPDGNGRAIRLFLEVIAREQGFRLNLNYDSKHKRRSYNRAVELDVRNKYQNNQVSTYLYKYFMSHELISKVL
ncbi:Fic family protein [Piscirickettsia salmonis]|uniref:Fic/DOC family protein n=1 Tax=Piscirickettsia salmonis TaxID=1238 RepID=UPI0024C36030|nr:Fic family protein [Piscirickettsia salmonis]WGZ73267.1 hypothetical protein E3220_16860 [Piscirickettsia salmonis]